MFIIVRKSRHTVGHVESAEYISLVFKDVYSTSEKEAHPGFPTRVLAEQYISDNAIWSAIAFEIKELE